MSQLNPVSYAGDFVGYPAIAAIDAGLGERLLLKKDFYLTAQKLCAPSPREAFQLSSQDGDMFGGNVHGIWFSQNLSSEAFPAAAKLGVTKLFTRREIYSFTEQEICDSLDRAISLICNGTEGQFLSDRLEPWIGLARPMSHNIATRVYYWPDVEI